MGVGVGVGVAVGRGVGDGKGVGVDVGNGGGVGVDVGDGGSVRVGSCVGSGVGAGVGDGTGVSVGVGVSAGARLLAIGGVTGSAVGRMLPGRGAASKHAAINGSNKARANTGQTRNLNWGLPLWPPSPMAQWGLWMFGCLARPCIRSI